MIELKDNLDTNALRLWLEHYIRQYLTADVSTYAPGRARAWLCIEPTLGKIKGHRRGVPVKTTVMMRLQELIDWSFDYCLVTYSGDDAIGILPHRDSSFADYEAYGLNISGTCEFSYWNDRKSFNKSASSGSCPFPGPPSDVFQLKPGDLIRFNCKNVHGATPSANRWNMNFWRKSDKFPGLSS